MDTTPFRVFMHLRTVPADTFSLLVAPMLVPGEKLLASFQGDADGLVFTDRRILSVTAQNMSGKQKMYTTFPYHYIRAFSAEPAAVPGSEESEIFIWFADLGKMQLNFAGQVPVEDVCRILGQLVLDTVN